MKARNLASPRETLRTDDPASEAARILSRHDVRAILVVDASDEFAGVISDSELLRPLLPPYLEENESLAGNRGARGSMRLLSANDAGTEFEFIFRS